MRRNNKVIIYSMTNVLEFIIKQDWKSSKTQLLTLYCNPIQFNYSRLMIKC